MSVSGAEHTLAIAGSGLFGLAVGSFLNVVVYRLPRHMSLSQPPSSCPACGARLTVIDLFPVLSWLALRAWCRHCGSRISPRYPVVELTTGAVFAGTTAAVGIRWPLIPVLVLEACAIAAGILDADGEEVPVPLGVLAAGAALALVVLAGVLGDVARPGWALVGAGLAAGAGIAADRGRGIRRLRPLAIVVSLGAAAGALWAGGGPLVAAWVVVAAAAASGSGAARRARPLVLVAGAFAAVIVSALVGLP